MSKTAEKAKIERDILIRMLEHRKQEYKAAGLSDEDADECASEDIRRAIWNTRPGSAW